MVYVIISLLLNLVHYIRNKKL